MNASRPSFGKIKWLIPVHLYATLLLLAVGEFIWIIANPITIVSEAKLLIALKFILVILSLIITSNKIKHGGDSRIWLPLRFTLEAILILTIGWIVLRLFNHLAMTAQVPYQDNLLMSWESYLGTDWLAYFNYVYTHPFLRETLDLAYSSLTPVSAVALFCLLLMGKFSHARFFIVAFIYTAILATFAGAFFPAFAAVSSLVPDIDQYQAFNKIPGTYHIGYLEQLRATSGEIVISLDKMPGLTTFPSFHTSAGIILIAAFWRTILFIPALAYASLMIASTPVFGGHYFIDLVGGVALAVLVIAVVSPLCRRF